MSNSKNLLEEAIADAKSVKEAAIANAKAALEEAFAPYLAEKFAAKLAEMEDEDPKEAYEVDEEMELEEKMSNPVQRKGDDEKKNGKFSKESKPEEETEMMAKKLKKEGDLDEMDLEELLRELEEEEMLQENARTDAEEEGYLDGMKDEKEDEEDKDEDIELDLEDMSEDELEKLVKDVIEDMVRAGEIEAGENFEEEETEDIEVSDSEEETIDENARTAAEEEGYLDGMHDEKYDLTKEEKMDEGIKDKLKKFVDTLTDPEKALIPDDFFKFADKMNLLPAGTVTKGMEKSGAGKTSSIGEAEKERAKMQQELNELRATLNEVKLLNAKLLYTNKIFRGKNLTENQKVKVLQAFDKASTVKETKLVFETLSSELKEKKAPVNESIRGLASKPTGAAPTKQPILESNDQVIRWQKLAGIIKS
jgi:hypothetical protein